MKTSIILTIFLFSTQVSGSLTPNTEKNHEREALQKVAKISAYQIFTGTSTPREDNHSGMETWEPIQLAACETTGLGGSTNRNICNNPY